MQQTGSLEKHRTRKHHAQAEADYGGDFPRRVALEERYLHYVPASGFLSVAYERFLQMPVAVVLTVLWVAGVALLSLCVLTLYILGTSLASVVAGA